MAAQAMTNPKILYHSQSSLFGKDGSAHRGLSHGAFRRTNPKKLDLVELVSFAIRAAHVARDKGFYAVSPEAVRCVEILKQIEGMHVTARVISESNTFPTLQYLTKNGNPKIRSVARSLLDHCRHILSSEQGDHRKGTDGKASSLTRKPDTKRFVQKKPYANANPTVKNRRPQKSPSFSLNGRRDKASIGKTELLELFEVAKKAAMAVKGSDSGSADASRCINTLKLLSQVPRSLTRDVVLTTDIGSRLYSLAEHSNPSICCAALSLLNFWRMILYMTGRTDGHKSAENDA